MAKEQPAEQVGPLVARLFRRESGRMTAWLMRWLGPEQTGLAEDAVQDALLAALRAWPFKGIPDTPSHWLWRAARNAAIDRMRRSGKEVTTDALPELRDQIELPDSEDDELLLIFLCADPFFSAETSVPLTLKLACGFSDAEVAGALSQDAATVRQRIVRAKRRWRDVRPGFDLAPMDKQVRCSAVMNVIYLMLSEGYGGHNPLQWQRTELCREAARLAVLLAQHRDIDRRDADALAALCLFQAARTPGRVSGTGDILLTDEQDRSLWNRRLIAEGFRWLDRAGHGDRLTAYHLLAGIASCHVIAPTYAETDWDMVRDYYDRLVEVDPASPFHKLNRAVAIAESGAPGRAHELLATLEHDHTLARSYLLPATNAWVLNRLGRLPEARRELMLAVDRAPSDPVRQQLQARLKDLQ